MPRSDKILITGSSGMLGVDLCQELADDYEVVETDIVSRLAGLPVSQFYKADITDVEAVEEAVKKASPKVVVHAAAWTDVDGCEGDKDKAYRINGQGTANVAGAASVAGAVLIYISTDFVFDGRKAKPYKEDDRPNPLSVYGESKLKGEEAVRTALEKYLILRTSWLYGAHGENFVEAILEKARKEPVLKIVDDQVGSPTYTKDLAKALHALLDKIFTRYEIRDTRYGVYHVSNSGSVSWHDYAKEILRLAGSAAKVIPISSKELNRPARRPAMSVLDNSKFTGFTGYRMRRWQDALEEYMSEKRKG